MDPLEYALTFFLPFPISLINRNEVLSNWHFWKKLSQQSNWFLTHWILYKFCLLLELHGGRDDIKLIFYSFHFAQYLWHDKNKTVPKSNCTQRYSCTCQRKSILHASYLMLYIGLSHSNLCNRHLLPSGRERLWTIITS